MTYELDQTEEEYMEIEVPECWLYFDEEDRSCTRRCLVREYCKAEQENNRAPCFGLMYNEDDPECSNCLVESQCVETYESLVQGGTEMVKKNVRVRRVRRSKPAKVEEPEVEEELEEEEEVEETPAPKKVVRKSRTAKKVEPEPEEEEEEEEEEGYDTMSISALRAELKDRGLDSTGRKAQLIERLMADDAGELEEDDEEEEPEPAPKKTVRKVVKRSAGKVEPESEEEEEPVQVSATLEEFLENLPTGAVVTAVRVDDDTFQFSFGGEVAAVAAPKGKTLRGAAYWKEVCDPVYYHFYFEDAGTGKAWEDMNPDEREEFAEEMGLEWEEHEDDRITKMNMFRAISAELGLEKYKPEYKSPSARKALR